AEPVGIFVTTYGTTRATGASGETMSDGEIAERVSRLFDLRPSAIVRRLKLTQPMYSESAAYGHMGRENVTVSKPFMLNGMEERREVELFTWEKLDYVDQIRAEFGLNQ